MKVAYDAETDTLTVVLKERARIVESDEGKPGVVFDYDELGTWSRWKSSMHPGV